MVHIFISYSRKNKEYAQSLAKTLTDKGFNVWIDDRIDYGDRWWRTIVKAIEECAAFIVIMSPEAEQSEWVEREILLAQRAQKPIFPLLLEGKEFSLLITSQFADVSNGMMPPEDFHLRLARVISPMEHKGEFVAPKPNDDIPSPSPKRPWTLYAAVVVMVLIAGFVVLSNLQPDVNGDVAQAPTETQTLEPTLTQMPSLTASPTDETTLTPTLTPSITHTPTEMVTELPIALIVGTLDAQATVDQLMTDDALETEMAIGQTETAALWTDTPMPDMTASIEAYRTEQAATTTQDWIESWTATPTNTPTPNATATLIAFRPQTNADWTPVERDFDSVTMVLVPAGCFMMGSTNYDNAKPVHEQCFDTPFWIDKHEVTQGQFLRLDGVKANDNRFMGDERPLESITWFEARDFCDLRGSRLPTEREWEYAARGPDNLLYPWGNEFIADNVVYRGNSNNQTAVVGSRPAGTSWVGALDMSGNVWEWTSSLYESYPYDVTDGREADTGYGTDVLHVLRGDSWDYYLSDGLIAPYRLGDYPLDWLDYFGFRCARSYE